MLQKQNNMGSVQTGIAATLEKEMIMLEPETMTLLLDFYIESQYFVTTIIFSRYIVNILR